MEYTYLGRAGMRVSRMCLGTMNFGVQTEEKEAHRILDLALDAGINFVDTADMYGGWASNGGHHGWTEEIIGRWFALGGGRRERTILATKIFNPTDDPYEGVNDEPGMSLYKARRHTEACLRRLQTDHVELMYIHDAPEYAGWTEIWGAFEALVNQGKIDYMGCSNIGAYQIAMAQAAAEKRNFLGFVCNQSKYNLCARLPEMEIFPCLKAQGMGFLAFSPLSGGQLTGGIFKELQKGQRTNKYAGRLSDARLERLRRYSALCAEIGESESHVALAWCLAQSALTSVLIGPRTAAQLEDTLKAIDLKLPADFLEALDKLFPGVGRTAPYVYLNETPGLD